MNNSKEKIKEFREEYLELVLKDPCLPYDLLPSDWPAEDVRRVLL